MKVYVVISIEQEKSFKVSSIEPLGVYSDFETAMKYVDKLQGSRDALYPQIPKEDREVVFDVFEFEVDKEPILLSYLKSQEKLVSEMVDKTIENLMRDGLIEQLIGEDGHFYYELTKKGEGKANKLRGLFSKKSKWKKLDSFQEFFDDEDELDAN